MSGDQPLIVGIDRASDIESLLTFIADTDLSIVIDGGAEAWRHADALAEAGVAVLVDPTVFGPGGFDQLQGRPDNAKLLADAGVKVMLGHTGTHNARLVAHQAGIAVGQGLSAEQALAAVTSTPREVFGVGGGALTAGTSATFVIWESVTSEIPTDPFEPTTRAVAVYIDGVAQDMGSRQTDLRDRYIGLPGSPLVPLTPQ
jgi:imidazolonepropionase-like amidohydrolase